MKWVFVNSFSHRDDAGDGGGRTKLETRVGKVRHLWAPAITMHTYI